MGVCLGLHRQQVVLHPSAAKPKCPVISQVPKKLMGTVSQESWNKAKRKIYAGVFCSFSSLEHYGTLRSHL